MQLITTVWRILGEVFPIPVQYFSYSRTLFEILGLFTSFVMSSNTLQVFSFWQMQIFLFLFSLDVFSLKFSSPSINDFVLSYLILLFLVVCFWVHPLFSEWYIYFESRLYCWSLSLCHQQILLAHPCFCSKVT